MIMFFFTVFLIFGLTRLYNLDLIPIFADEAIYLRWAQLMAYDWHNLFVPLTDGKTPLFMWLLAPLLKLRLDPLLTGRVLSAAAGLGTIAGIYFLTKKLFEVKTARLAAWLVLFCPFLLFYDRMSLTDGLLTTLIVWSVYFVDSYFLALTAAAALLVKPSALLMLAIMPLFYLKQWKKWLPAGFAALGLYNLLRLSGQFYMIQQRSLDYLRPPAIENLFSTSQVFFDWLVSYLSWPLIFTFALSMIIAAKFKEKKIGLLSLLVIVSLAVQAAVGKIVYPRYLLPLVPFILIIAAWGLSRMPKLLMKGLLIFILALWLRFDYYLITDPVNASLHPAEKEQYFESWSAGYGLKEIRKYLMALPTGQKAVVATEGSFGTLPNGLEIYFSGHPDIQILGVGFPAGGMTAGMEQALSAGNRLFLVANKDRFTLPPESRLSLINQFPRPGGEQLLFYEVF